MKKVLLLVTCFAMFLTTGCSAAWLSTLDAILEAAAPALVDILQVVAAANGQPVNAALVAKINVDSAAIRTLASEFAIASGAAAPGVCSQLQAAISAYQADQQLVLSTAQVSDANTQSKIELLSDLVTGTVNAVMAVIPSCHAAQPATATTAPAVRLTKFAALYNEILTAKTGNRAVDVLTPHLKVHERSKVVRVFTLGELQ